MFLDGRTLLSRESVGRVDGGGQDVIAAFGGIEHGVELHPEMVGGNLPYTPEAQAPYSGGDLRLQDAAVACIHHERDELPLTVGAEMHPVKLREFRRHLPHGRRAVKGPGLSEERTQIMLQPPLPSSRTWSATLRP